MYPCCNDFLYCCHGINLHPIPSSPLHAYFLIYQYFWQPTTITFSISLMSTSLELSSSYILNAQRNLSSGLLQRTRPGVNYAKDWMNHLFHWEGSLLQFADDHRIRGGGAFKFFATLLPWGRSLARTPWTPDTRSCRRRGPWSSVLVSRVSFWSLTGIPKYQVACDVALV